MVVSEAIIRVATWRTDATTTPRRPATENRRAVVPFLTARTLSESTCVTTVVSPTASPTTPPATGDPNESIATAEKLSVSPNATNRSVSLETATPTGR